MAAKKSTGKKSYRKFFPQKERDAFKMGLNGYSGANPSKMSAKERQSYDRGKKIGKSKDYQIAERYTDHMNFKFGSWEKTSSGGCKLNYDKQGRVLGIDGEPMPTAYQNYKSMQKDPKLKKGLYEEYDF